MDVILALKDLTTVWRRKISQLSNNVKFHHAFLSHPWNIVLWKCKWCYFDTLHDFMTRFTECINLAEELEWPRKIILIKAWKDWEKYIFFADNNQSPVSVPISNFATIMIHLNCNPWVITSEFVSSLIKWTKRTAAKNISTIRDLLGLLVQVPSQHYSDLSFALTSS